MKRPNIFILSLPDEDKRKQSAHHECEQYNLSYEFINSFDFRNVNREEVIQFYQPSESANLKHKYLSNTEIACALGHQKIYQKIISEKIPFALILEDDFKFIENPHKLLNNIGIIHEYLNFDVLILGYVKMLEKDLKYHYRRLPIQKQFQYLHYSFGKPWKQFSCGTVSYLITLEGAKKLKTDIISITADDWLHCETYNALNIFHIRPLIILENCEVFKSNIRQEKQNHLQIKKTSYIIRSIKGLAKNFVMNQLKWKK